MSGLPGSLLVAAAVPWRPVGYLTGSGLLLFCVAAAWPASTVAHLAVVVGVGALAAASAYLLDEAAVEAVSATPTSLWRRSRTRLVVAAAVVGMGVLGLAIVAERSGSTGRLGATAPLAGFVLVALAVSAALGRRLAEPGEVVGAALLGLVVVLAVARPFERWVDLFPLDAASRWRGALVVWGSAALVSVGTLARTLRDPFD